MTQFIDAVNGVLWHEYMLYGVLAIGVLFTLWSGGCQYHALTRGVALTFGRGRRDDGPGAITHFQALSAALSATVGLGNIGGVAVAVALGGPGAVFWMWVVGFIGMALKTAEVTLSMLYRDTSDPSAPVGGPMWVARRGMARRGPGWARVGAIVGGVFCVTLLISAITGGNMFQAWNVAAVTHANFGIPPLATGIVLAVLVALVILGGIGRIGSVAGALVPFMCGLYLLAAVYVLIVRHEELPRLFALIFEGAFSDLDGEHAFVGGTAGMAFAWGMKRALFSNEAGQGSSPIAHAAVKTNEPVTEGIVAGLEPFIDTLVVCTLTALVILASGAWNRGPDARLAPAPVMERAADGAWQLPAVDLPAREGGWPSGDAAVFAVAEVDGARARVSAAVERDGDTYRATWAPVTATTAPHLVDDGVYANYPGAALTSHAFDRVAPGLGTWVVSVAVWLFALSTMISWSYYGEQGIIYLVGRGGVPIYRLVYCGLVVVACSGIIADDAGLDRWSSLGTGVMLAANLPITLLFGREAMAAYRDYVRRKR